MNRLEFVDSIIELVDEDITMSEGTDEEIIYVIDGIEVYGGFEYGIRGVDHNSLLSEGVTWEQVIEWGTIVVPETRTYVSEDSQERFDLLGYERLPLGRNHIMGSC